MAFGIVSDIILFFLWLQITESGTRPHAKWAVSLVIANGHFSAWGICVGMYRIATAFGEVERGGI